MKDRVVHVSPTGVTVCAVGALGELATLAANAGAVSIVAASRTAAIFLFIVILPSGHWLIETGPTIMRPLVCRLM
jgi:hypothetical protein